MPSAPLQGIGWETVTKRPSESKLICLAGRNGSSDVEQLAGLWRLVYSSGFASSGSTGGSRPGLPVNLLPAQLGQACFQGPLPCAHRLRQLQHRIGAAM